MEPGRLAPWLRVCRQTWLVDGGQLPPGPARGCGPAGVAAQRVRRGSSASRKASPNRLIDNTVIMIATPGKLVTHGADRKNSRPFDIIAPHSGVGGCAPKPRKLSPAASRIEEDTYSVASTTAGPTTLGRIW